MSTNPSILLQGQPVQDPLTQYSRVLALKNALGQQQEQQQAIQSGALDLQSKQRLMADQQKISQILGMPDVGGDIEKAIPRLGAAGVSAPTIIGLQKAHLENKKLVTDTTKAQADADEANQKVKTAQTDLLGNALVHVRDQKYTPESFIAATSLLESVAPQSKAQIDQYRARVANSPDPQATIRQIVDNALATSGVGAKIDAQRAQSASDTAGANQKQAEADKTKFELDLQKGAVNGTGDALIQQRFAGNPQALQSALQAWHQNLPAGVKTATDEVNKVYDNTIGAPGKAAATITAESAPKVAAARAMVPVDAARAAAEANATEPIRARANADAQAYLMKQVGGPLQNVMDPGERARISGEYLKASDAYAEKAADAQRLKDFVAAARSGNQSAAGLMTITELRSVVNRVNKKELEQAGGASLLRSITNKLDKAGEGIPSEDTLKELEKVADLNDKTAQGSFAQKVRGIKAISPKANLSETPIGATTAPKVGDTKTFPNGKVGKWDGTGWAAQGQ